MILINDPIARLLGSWSTVLGPGSILQRILLSLILAAVIGWERSSKRHSAGLRTFMLVSLLGTTVAILDGYIFSVSGQGIFLLSCAAIIGSATISIHSVF